jgi:hypothetical protein
MTIIERAEESVLTLEEGAVGPLISLDEGSP